MIDTPVTPTTETGPRPPALPEMSWGGISRFDGIVTEEYLPELTGLRKVRAYTEMRNDGKVEATLGVCKLPLVGGKWQVLSGGSQARAKKAAEMVQRQCGIGLRPGQGGLIWSEEVDKSLQYLDYGFQLLVQNWHRATDGEIVLDEQIDIHPKTLYQGTKQWDFDRRGRVKGFWQTGLWSGEPQSEYIPIERCVHLRHKPQHGNPEGRSVLRSAYKHWFYKDEFYRLDGIAHERGACGLPVGTHPDNAPENVVTSIESACQGIVVAEKAYVVKPASTTLENFDLQLKTEQLYRSIDHHDSMIPLVVVAQFLNLGTGMKTGGLAMSENQTDFFMRVMEAYATYLSDMFTRYIAHRIVWYNFPNLKPELYPSIVCQIDRISVMAFADALRKLLGPQQAALSWTRRDQDQVRGRLGMAPMDDDTPDPPVTPPAGGANDAGSLPDNPDSEAPAGIED